LANTRRAARIGRASTEGVLARMVAFASPGCDACFSGRRLQLFGFNDAGAVEFDTLEPRHSTLMLLTLIFVAAIGAVALTERSVEQLAFAIAALFFNVALLLIFVADFERAILLSGMLALAIAGASIIKFNHSALKLTVCDLPLAFAGTVPFFVS